MLGKLRKQDFDELAKKYKSVGVSTHNGKVMYTYLYADDKLFSEEFGREVRGVVFSQDGELLSRPYHKFFNYGESLAPLGPNKTVSSEILVAEKADGSLVQISWTGKEFVVASRATINPETSYVRNRFFDVPEHDVALTLARKYENYTHLFELEDPAQPIVVIPKKLRLRYLASRNKKTGKYEFIREFIDSPLFNAVVFEPLNKSLEEFLDYVRGLEGTEGFVLFLPELNDFVKIKTPWYLQLHGVQDVTKPPQFVKVWATEEIDDLISLAAQISPDGPKYKLFKKVKEILDNEVNSLLNKLEPSAKELADISDRKEKAMRVKELQKTFEPSEFSGILMSAFMKPGNWAQNFVSLVKEKAQVQGHDIKKYFVEKLSEELANGY